MILKIITGYFFLFQFLDGTCGRGVLIHGPTGAGKRFLAEAVCRMTAGVQWVEIDCIDIRDRLVYYCFIFYVVNKQYTHFSCTFYPVGCRYKRLF